MANVTVYFATNRVAQGPLTDWHSYGAQIVTPMDPSKITYAAAFVQGVDMANEDSGAIAAIQHAQAGGFQPGLVQDIVGAGKDLLIFIHGFANSFLNSIARAAFIREWFAASGVNAADTTVIAFSWPSLGQFIAAPPHLLPDDYLRDQSQANRSSFHIASFFAGLEPIMAQLRGQGRRVFLLAHSMGNFALAAAVDTWFTHSNPVLTLFDETFLAAADERWDSFALPMDARLSQLPRLTPRISVYYSERDVALYLSVAVNFIIRLGHEGPVHKSDPALFPPSRFRLVNCADVDDYNMLNPPDASHQYYRRSPKVRADIARAMIDDPTLSGGLVKL